MILRLAFALVDAALSTISATSTLARFVVKKIDQAREGPPQPLSYKDVEWQRQQMRRATKGRSDD